MLIITVEEQEFYDAEKEQFLYTKPTVVRMEHSLISVAKWESFWERPYLAVPGIIKGISTPAENQHYMECMIIGKVPKYVPGVLYQNHREQIINHINKKHTATRITRRGLTSPASRKIITADLIYYWMIKFGIDFECQTWHFNRLITLIDVCNVKESTGKGSKLTAAEAASYKHELNKARRRAYDKT